MSFSRYPKYKPSGVEWLGEVPEHWGVRRIGYLFDERREKVSDKDHAALSVTKNGVVPQLETAAKTDDGDNHKRVCPGDFVINSRSDRKGSSGLSALGGSVSLINTVLVPREHLHGTYVHHLLRSVPFQEEFYRNGKGIVADLWSTNGSEMRGIMLPVPPLAEQESIAGFVDREAWRIDELLAEQERLVELLKEKRQAVISHAVTKGLNPDAPMKPSGIEWLGDVPAHWDVVPLKRFVGMQSGEVIGAERIAEEGAYAVFGGNGVRGFTDGFTHDGTYVLIGRQGALCGNINYASGRFWASEHAIVVSPRGTLDVQWLGEMLRAMNLNRHSTSAAQPGIAVGDIRELYTVVPPAEEQGQIGLALLAERERIAQLEEAATTTVKLLRERRSALISAAVTGQIDVRNLVPSEVA